LRFLDDLFLLYGGDDALPPFLVSSSPLFSKALLMVALKTCPLASNSALSRDHRVRMVKSGR
jgi:hypothetical protein